MGENKPTESSKKVEIVSNFLGLSNTANFLSLVIRSNNDSVQEGGDGSLISRDLQVTNHEGTEGTFEEGDSVEDLITYFGGEDADIEVDHHFQDRWIFEDGSSILKFDGLYEEGEN